MRLQKAGSNQTIITTPNGTRVLYSYNTPVAAWMTEPTELTPGNIYIYTDCRWSRTTSRHISAFLDGAEAVPVPQSFLESLV